MVKIIMENTTYIITNTLINKKYPILSTVIQYPDSSYRNDFPKYIKLTDKPVNTVRIKTIDGLKLDL